MRPFTSTKKPLESGHPINDKKPYQHKQTSILNPIVLSRHTVDETESTKKLKSSASTRLLNNLTSKPLSKRVNSPVGSESARSLKRCPEMASLSPKNRKQISEEKLVKGDKKLNKKVAKEYRMFEYDEEEVKDGRDFCEKEEEYHVAGSTKCTDKESENCSVNNEEDEKEREKLREQIGWCAVRPIRRGTLKQREMFEQLNGSFNQEERKSSLLVNANTPEKGDLNSKQSLKSTIIISESPMARLKTREDEFFSGSSEVESAEQSFEKYGSSPKIISSDVWDTPRTEKSVESKASSRKSKLNLEVYLAILNLLRDANVVFAAGESLMELLGEYICLAPAKDSESFEKLFKKDNECRVIKSSFVLERLVVVLVLYFTEELKTEKNVDELIATLLELLYENCLIFGHLMSEKVRDSTENDWMEQLLDILENEGVVGLTREKSFERMQNNNSTLSTTMKNMLTTLQHKEVVYGYNSIIVQADRIPPKEAYTRMLKSLSVYASERELKSQAPKLKASGKKKIPEKIIKEQKTGAPQKESKIVEKSKEIKKVQKEEPVSYYLPKPLGDKKYTLVLDLDETLVHFAEIPGDRNELRVRPYADYFLTEVSKYYEVVVFTTGVQEYADWVLDNIDKHLSVSHRLYRHHACVDIDTSSFIKDLSRLGRDLSKVLIVDNLQENFRLQPDNGIAIKPWYDDHEDNALLELAPLLVEIASKNVKDVRVALRKFREQMLANIENGVENPHLNLNLDDSC